MEPDALHKLADIGGEIILKKKSLGIFKQLGNLCIYAIPGLILSFQHTSCHYLIHESALQRIFGYIKNGSTKLFWVPDKKMLAGGFTNPLSWPAFKDKRARIGVVDIEEDN